MQARTAVGVILLATAIADLDYAQEEISQVLALLDSEFGGQPDDRVPPPTLSALHRFKQKRTLASRQLVVSREWGLGIGEYRSADRDTIEALSGQSLKGFGTHGVSHAEATPSSSRRIAAIAAW